MIALGIVFRKFDKDLFAFTSLALIFGGMTLFFLRDQTQWLSRLTQWHGFHLISRLSYGIYLNHFEILTPSMAPLSHWLGGYLGTGILLCSVIYAITLLLSIGVAWLTYALIEYPFLRLRDRLLSSSH
jgi:peptidoglycan/LPS O-acetylase OafA/YrhL